jgi:large subunit ribosomal protein L9
MIEVILREDIRSLGRAGELVRVKPGYARNYLLPQGLAYEATEGNRKRIAAEQKARTARSAADRVEAERAATELAGLTLTFSRKAGEEGKLFGSITSQDIAESLGRQGHAVDRRKIELEHPIKTIGQHTVGLRLHPDVHAELRVSVTPE